MAKRADLTSGAPVEGAAGAAGEDDEDDDDATEAILATRFNGPGAA